MMDTKGGEIPFIFTDQRGKSAPAQRQLIRKHVMLGKNRGRTRTVNPPRNCSEGEGEGEDQQKHPGLILRMEYAGIPRNVGSGLSFLQLAAPVEPTLINDLLKFSFIAKSVMYPLETCISFPKITKVDQSWVELLTSDAAYLHTAVFTLQGFAALSGRKISHERALQSLSHYSEALRLLRERISSPHEEQSLSDSTLLVVLYLALHAYFMNDCETAKNHIEGLGMMVKSRGGLSALSYNTKLVIELLKCDLVISLQNGNEPIFFMRTSPAGMPPYELGLLTPYDFGYPAAPATRRELLLLGAGTGLIQVWSTLNTFSSMVNATVKSKRQLPRETLLNAMASSMYPLLPIARIEPVSIDAALSLGILAFSFNIFLSWKDVRLPCMYLADVYRRCLLCPRLPYHTPPRIFVWLLFVGSVSVFGEVDDRWLVPLLRMNMEKCNISTWDKCRELLSDFMWIEFLQERKGLKVFERATNEKYEDF